MHRWHRDPIIWLMLLSTLMLLGISAYWIRSSYEQERSTLQREGTFVFRTAVLELEDSLRTIAFEKFGSIRPGRVELLGDSARLTTIIIDRDTLHDRRRPLPRPSRGTADQFRGSLALQLKLTASDRPAAEVMQDRSPESNLPSLIARKAYAILQADDLPYGVLFDDSLKLTELEAPLLTRHYNDVFTNQKIYAAIINYHPSILRKILSEILLSLFMISVTLLAFRLMYRSIQKQSRLAQTRRDLISNITHELQTPISTVKVALEALQNFSSIEGASEKTREYLAISQLELTRLSFLVDTVLKNSIAEEESSNINDAVDLKSLIQAAIRSMSLQFEKRSAQVNFEAESSTYMVLGDQIQLSSVIYNLLDNALKYSTADPIINIKLTADDEQTILTINDQGIGIPKEYQRKVFDRFFRVPQGNTHNVKGYGLGLTHVRQVIDRHQGKISVRANTDSGTEFLIKLPSYYEGA